MFHIEIANKQTRLAPDESRLREAVQHILNNASYSSAAIGLVLVDDPTIHELNRRFLDHDYATDVLSFVLEEDQNHLEGEVVASTDTAARSAPDWGWSADDELLLYVVHGTLHLVGYDDSTPDTLAEMRACEENILQRLGLARQSRQAAQGVRP